MGVHASSVLADKLPAARVNPNVFIYSQCIYLPMQALSSHLENVPQEPGVLGKAEAMLAHGLLGLGKHQDKVGFGTDGSDGHPLSP